MTNTKFTYMYRDADNYKLVKHVVMAGEISQVSVDVVSHCLDEGLYFIPSQVDLVDLQPEPVTEADHVWHELLGFTPTDDEPTVALTADELVDRFAAVKWDPVLARILQGID